MWGMSILRLVLTRETGHGLIEIILEAYVATASHEKIEWPAFGKNCAAGAFGLGFKRQGRGLFMMGSYGVQKAAFPER